MTDTTTIRLYDTMRREKVDFQPIDPKNVRMYVCGPTVYDRIHIGNARPLIVFDVLFRLLRHVYGEENVTYVRNITDVDDKINARAAELYPDLSPDEGIRKLTDETIEGFHADAAALGCLPPTHEPRATDNIPQMIALVEQLLRNGYAYEAVGEGGREVLFDVTSMADYGALSNRRLDQQRAGARVEAKDYKRHPGDFVLWKEAAPNEPGWDSPFGRGRPGWHLECSAMSERYLGQTFDIHCGGIDLAFPHHENEIAQSRCAHGTDAMANVWMHNGFLQVEGKKMSKSEGNFITVHEVLRAEQPALLPTDNPNVTTDWKRRWNGLTARLSMLQTHYREPIDWTQDRLERASNELLSWYEGLRSVSFDSSTHANAAGDVAQALMNDLNVPEGLTAVRTYAGQAHWRAVGEGLSYLGLLDPFFVENDDILLFDRQAVADKHTVNHSINKRLTLLSDCNFAEADRIRDELAAEGIQLMDYKDPETGERRTKWEVKR